MKYTRTLMAAAALMIAGCGPTMPVKADAEQAPQEPAVVMPQGPVGIPVKVGETSIKPFLVTLGTPAKEAKLADDHVLVAYLTNRIGVAKQGETPVIVVLPADDPRLPELAPKALILDLKKVEDDWLVQGLRLGDPEEAEGKADKTEKPAAKKADKKPVKATRLEPAKTLHRVAAREHPTSVG